MTRITSAPIARGRRSVSSTAAKRNKQYKVEFKLVTAQKKQLKISNNPPPPGHKFVATGSEEFTNYCKEQCRKSSRTVYVSQSKDQKRQNGASFPNPNPNRVGFYIRRDGLFFPAAVVDKACSWFGVAIDEDGKTTQPNNFLSRTVRTSLRKYNKQSERAQIDGVVRELFPKIPEDAARSIIKHAFESRNKKRVGNARELDLAGRVQLAVNAHIRHTYTNYDQLLKDGMSWPDARAQIGPACIIKLKEWMDEDGHPELEETFQEWIDLRDDDDDDSDESLEYMSDVEPNRRTSWNGNGMQAIHEAPHNVGSVPHYNRIPRPEFADDARMVRYRDEPQYVLPSVESPSGHVREQYSQRPVSHPIPQSAFFLPPPPPAPSPPSIHHGHPHATYVRHVQPSPGTILRRIDPDRHHHHPEHSNRPATRAYRRDVIDLTASPNTHRTQRQDEYPSRRHVVADHSAYYGSEQGIPPSPVFVQPLRGGGNVVSSESQLAGSTYNSVARPVIGTNDTQPLRRVNDVGLPTFNHSYGHPNTAYSPLARDVKVGGLGPFDGGARLPSASMKRGPEPPHPDVPRYGWVAFGANHQQREEVRLWCLRKQEHRHVHFFCGECQRVAGIATRYEYAPMIE